MILRRPVVFTSGRKPGEPVNFMLELACAALNAFAIVCEVTACYVIGRSVVRALGFE